jgi:hypothetical protein
MKLIKTTPSSSPDVPRLKPRRAPWKVALVIWLIALTIVLVAVLLIFVRVYSIIYHTALGMVL